MKKLFLILFTALTVFACSKENTPEIPPVEDKISYLVVNEGQYGKGTAELSVVYKDGTVDWNIFEKVNGRPIGDVAQYIEYMNGKYYVTLNNSKKVEVIDAETFASLATIVFDPGQATAPLYIAQVSEEEAVVSDYRNLLTKIDIKNDKVNGYVALSKPIYKMVSVNNKLFGVSPGNIVVFDNSNITAEGLRNVKDFTAEDGSALTTYQSAKVIVDKNNKIWVLTNNANSNCVLVCIDSATESVVSRVAIPFAKKGTEAFVDGALTRLEFYPRVDTDRTKGNIYFNGQAAKGDTDNNAAVFKLNIATKELTLYKELTDVGMTYGMGVSPDGDVVICDCLDYSAQRGFTREFLSDGTVVSRQIGVYPRMVHFREYDK